MHRAVSSGRRTLRVVGFADPSYFTRVFRRQEGISPSEYRATTVFEADDVQSAAAG